MSAEKVSMSSSPNSSDSSPAPRFNGSSKDRPLSAGSTSEMPLSPPMVMSLPEPLPPRTMSSSSSFLPERSTDESLPRASFRRRRHAAVRQADILVERQVEFLEVGDLRGNLVLFLRRRPSGRSPPAGWMSLSARRTSLSAAALSGDSMPMTVPDIPASAGPSSVSLSKTSPSSADAGPLLGDLLDVFGLELPVGAVAVSVQLAALQQLLDFLFADAKGLGCFFYVEVLARHRDLPLRFLVTAVAIASGSPAAGDSRR